MGLADSMKRAFLNLTSRAAAPQPAPEPESPPVPEAGPVDAYTQRLNAEMAKGNNMMNAGLHRQAVVHFKNMQKRYPCDPRITLKIGLAYKEMKEYSAAQEYIRKAVAQGLESHRYAAVLSELKVAQAKAYSMA